MIRHGHLNRTPINAIATESTTEFRDYPHSASSTTKLQRWQYGMMTQRRRQRLNRLRTTLPSHDQLQKRAVLPAHRARMSSPEIVTSSTFDGSTVIFATRHLSTRYSSSTHLCYTSLVDTLLVVNPSVRHVTCRHVTRRQPICATCQSSTRHSSETLQMCRCYATVRRITVSASSTAFRSPCTDQFVTL